jgi:hypothetical protein
LAIAMQRLTSASVAAWAIGAMACAATPSEPSVPSGVDWHVLDAEFIASLVFVRIECAEPRASGWCLLDTGQPGVALDAPAFGRASPDDETHALPGPGVMLTLGGVDVWFGGPAYDDVSATMSARIGRDVIGILGTDLFERFPVLIDYRDQAVAISERRPAPVPPGFERVALEAGGFPGVRTCTQVGDETVAGLVLVLDTGALTGVTIWDETASRLGPGARPTPACVHEAPDGLRGGHQACRSGRVGRRGQQPLQRCPAGRDPG